MAVEVYALIGCSGILFLLMFFQQVLVDKNMGTKYALSNRDEAPPMKGAIGRMLRAQQNLIANMAMFVPLVVAASLADVSNNLISYGALAFLGFRVIHAVTYSFGIILVRSLAWMGGIISMCVMTYGILFA